MNYNEIRKQNMKLYNQLYARVRFHDQRDKWRCFYCGQEAGTIDHQPPLSVIGSMVTSGIIFQCVTIPCCFQCNSILGNAQTTTLSERFELLKERLRTKYRKELRLAGQWTLSEILELGPSLRAMVTRSIRLGEDAESRILYPGHRIIHDDAHWNDGQMQICPNCTFVTDEHDCPMCGQKLSRR